MPVMTRTRENAANNHADWSKSACWRACIQTPTERPCFAWRARGYSIRQKPADLCSFTAAADGLQADPGQNTRQRMLLHKPELEQKKFGSARFAVCLWQDSPLSGNVDSMPNWARIYASMWNASTYSLGNGMFELSHVLNRMIHNRNGNVTYRHTRTRTNWAEGEPTYSPYHAFDVPQSLHSFANTFQAGEGEVCFH